MRNDLPLVRAALFSVAGLSLASTPAMASSAVTSNAFNPAMSVILDGQVTGYSENPEDYRIAGFPLGGEAGLSPEGLALGESELAVSSNIDDRFYGSLTASMHSEDGGTAVELEEAFIETVGLADGVTVKAGRFYSGLGYLNGHHSHTWDFADVPLVYRAMLAGQLGDDGVQVRWVAPTDLYLEVGGELLRGDAFPAAGAANDGTGARTGFVRLGGDIGASQSWQVGLSGFWADAKAREAQGGFTGSGAAAVSAFTGNTRLGVMDFVWKWAPNGNAYRTSLKLQGEYFQRKEDGDVAVDNDGVMGTTSYDGTQRGAYLQGVYQFMPRWRVGLRYDWLSSDNHGTDGTLLDTAGLTDGGHDPKRYSLMVDYSRTEFSRLRLQYNRDESQPTADNQWYLQYVMSLGAHGAHQF